MPFQMIIPFPVHFCLDHMFLDFNIVCVHWVYLDEKFLKMTEMIFGEQNGVLTFSDEAPDK